jgi:DNA-binding CsgD family transcriptional regulator
MGVRSEPIRHFDLRLRAKDRHTVVADIGILSLALKAPDHFLLIHVLKPSERAETPQMPSKEPAEPPRPALVAIRESPDARARRLTAREVEVLGMLAAGHTTPEIASRLHISAMTARNHIQNILEKLELHSKAEAVAFAFQKRLI